MVDLGEDLGDLILNFSAGVNPILFELNQMWLFKAFSKCILLPLFILTFKP